MNLENQFDPKLYMPYYGQLPKRNVESAMLIFDVVGFSTIMVNKNMMEIVDKIHKCIWDELEPLYWWNETRKDSKKNDFILIPTGDGYGIVLSNIHPDEEILKIAVSLYKKFLDENLKIRIGIAKGWNVIAIDANDDLNVFGYGIVLTTRVCNAAKDGQILVHADFVKTLAQKKNIDDFQEVKEPFIVKHGLEIKCFNYFKQNEFGII